MCRIKVLFTLLLFLLSPCFAPADSTLKPSEELLLIADDLETQTQNWTERLNSLESQTNEAILSLKVSEKVLADLETALQQERELSQAALEKSQLELRNWKTWSITIGSCLAAGLITSIIIR